MSNYVRLATINDLRGVMKCINDAKAFLKASGSTQWNGDDGYPNVVDLTKDIDNKSLYVCEVNGKIAGVTAFLGIEPEYENPVGEWICNTNNYLTIHRIAVSDAFRGQGIAQVLFKFAEAYAKKNKIDSIRVDTHPRNVIMQNIAIKMGFTACGYVMYKRILVEPKRLIYEKKMA